MVKKYFLVSTLFLSFALMGCQQNPAVQQNSNSGSTPSLVLAQSSDGIFTLRGKGICQKENFGIGSMQEEKDESGKTIIGKAYDLSYLLNVEDSDLGRVLVQTGDQNSKNPPSAAYKTAFTTSQYVVSAVLTNIAGPDCVLSVEKN